MRLLLLPSTLALVLLSSTTHAGVSNSTIVECSSFSENDAFFDACATWYQETPALTSISGHAVWVGNYKNEYTIVQGLKEGTDTFSLNATVKKEAYSSGIVVTVERDAYFECWVTVKVKGKITMCSSCTYCGDNVQSADCTNVKGGRSVTCESTGTGDVFFPFSSSAFNVTTMVPATAPPVQAPVVPPLSKAPTQRPNPPVTAPVSSPAPVAAPKHIRIPTVAPKQASLPISAPRQVVRAPIPAPRILRVPLSAPRQFKVPEVAPLYAKAPAARSPNAPVTAPAAAAPMTVPVRVRAPITKRRPVQKPSSVKPKPPK